LSIKFPRIFEFPNALCREEVGLCSDTVHSDNSILELLERIHALNHKQS